MKAFEITLNGKKTIVGAEDGLLTILVKIARFILLPQK